MFKVLLLLLLSLPSAASAATFSDAIRGRVLLDVEQHGEAWYVYPPTLERYFLGQPADAFRIMSGLGLGISDQDLAKIPTADSSAIGDIAMRTRLSGRILLQVEQHGEAWYVYPGNTKRYFLGQPADAFRIMSDLGLGITSANLARVPIAATSLPLPGSDSYSYRSITLTNARGSFPVKVITLRKDAYEMITDTAEEANCSHDCAALSLRSYVEENNGFAGIHGTYFCPPDYAACAGKVNTFLPPVFNTGLDTMLNETSLRHHDRPLVTYTTDGTYSYFHRTDDFGDTVAEFENDNQRNLRGAISNWPSLIENGVSVVANEPSESSFTVRATRGGLGFNDENIFLVVTQNATVTDFASIFQSLGATYAMNLDGGGSVALFSNGVYQVGPGRALPNAVIFRQK